MKNLLGIKHDYWHFLIPFFVLLIVPNLSGPVGINYWLLLGLSAWTVLTLQSLNENYQALNHYEIQKHGGWVLWTVNSKRDWKYFASGVLLGSATSFLMWALLLFLF